MAIGACDDCGKFFAGEVVEVREASCPECGGALRIPTAEEVDRYVREAKDEQRKPRSDGHSRGGLV